MVKSVSLFISVILSITVTVSGLQCYVCYDCAAIKDEYLQSCESISQPSNSTTTTASPSTSSSSSTTSTSTTTETPSTSSSTTTISTTANTSTTTQAPISNTSSTTVETFIIDKVEENYECFQGKINVNDSDVIIRGCAVGRTNETCATFGLSSCSFCGNDKCNSAGSMQSSAIVLISVFFLSVVIKV